MVAVLLVVATAASTVWPAAAQNTPPPAGPISGTARDAAGRPYAGRVVTLRENRGIASDVFGLFAAVATLGVSCLAGADPCRASGATATTTGADGRFTFAADAVAKARGESDGVILQFGDPVHDGSATVQVHSTGGDLGTIDLWNPDVTATPDGAAEVLRWTGPPDSNGRTVLAFDIIDGVPTRDTPSAVLLRASDEGATGEVAIDRRALEDRPATVVFGAGFSRPRAGQKPRIDWTSAPVRLPGGAGAPFSRGAGCVIDGLGAATAGCPLTDGDLITPVLPTQGREPPTIKAATVDLGRPRKVGLIAVRDEQAVTVEVSVDGQQFRPAASGRTAGRWEATVVSAGPAEIRFIRVTPGPVGYLDPIEVSAWPPEDPPQVPTAAPAGDIATARPAEHGAATRSGVFWIVAAVAAAVLVMAAIGMAFALGRRSGSQAR